MNLELVGALNELERERGISKEILFEAIEAAIVSAYKRNYGSSQNVRVEIGDRTGEIRVFSRKDVADPVEDASVQISLAEARELNPNYDIGDIVEIEVTPRDFGRIAAQTAKQVVIQRIREAERALIFEEYSNREGDIVTGIVQRSDHRTVLVDLGKTEALLLPGEQIPREHYAPGTRLKVYVSEVRKTTKGPQVYVSRSHPGLLKRLFELEVPEIHDGVVEIKAVAREAGNRSKIAVYSADPNVDPVGACVGPRGLRVQAVVTELQGEKIDIIAWHPDERRYIANALSPARVNTVYIDAEEKSARAVVPDNQLSLAIGKEGQNARLAARLCGWKIDIKSESQMAELAFLEAERVLEEREVARRAAEQAALAPEEIVGDEVLVEEGVAPSPDVNVAPLVAEAGPVVDDVAESEAEAVDEVMAEPELVERVVEDAEEDVDEPNFDLLAAELEEEEPVEDDVTVKKRPVTVAKPKKGRAVRKEFQETIEDVLDSDDPLPTLFGDDDPIPPDPPVGMSTRKAEPERETTRTAKRKEKEKRPSGVLKDFSELARLLEMSKEKD